MVHFGVSTIYLSNKTLMNTALACSRGNLEFEASLVYRVSSRTARAIQRNPVSKKKPKSKKKKRRKRKAPGGGLERWLSG